MNKKFYLLAVLAVSSVLYAQDTRVLDGQDMLEAFTLYNPASLQKAAQNEEYASLLNKLAQAYTAPRNEANELELIAIVKNFDNSIELETIKQQYIQGRTLQLTSGMELAALNAVIENRTASVMESIWRKTLEVKYIQLARSKASLKQVRKDTSLSGSDKKQQIDLLKNQIKQIKAEICAVKTDASSKIRATAQAYVSQLQAAYDAALQQEQNALQSATHEVKANHKKPVAQ